MKNEKKNAGKKLLVKRETLRNLSPRELTQAAGGWYNCGANCISKVPSAPETN